MSVVGALKEIVDILNSEFHSFCRIKYKWLIARTLKSDLNFNPIAIGQLTLGKLLSSVSYRN